MSTITTVIANHLNVVKEVIIEVQEWVHVLWVRIKGIGCRFVSKKIMEIKAEEIMDDRIPQTLEAAKELFGGRLFEWDASCIEMVNTLLKQQGEVEVVGTCESSFRPQLREIADRLNDSRLFNAIPTIASKLGANIRNY